MSQGGVDTGILRSIAHRVMQERGLEPDFPAAALTQVQALAANAADRVCAAAAREPGIRDLRERLWCSIDNDDSRDLDQLSVAEPRAGGIVRILAAIADVDALVAAGSPLDAHARLNTTSVYTVAQIFPMLPERLSTDLTSLAAGRDRLAVVIAMDVTPDGAIAGSEIFRALVHNRAKLAYDSVAAWLDGAAAMPSALAGVPGMDAQLRLQDQVAARLRAVRHEQGALTLETIEARAVIEGGLLNDLKPDSKNRAKGLIEDFMIAANGVSARFLDQRGVPALRRVVRAPKRWERLVALAAGLGGSLPERPDAVALNRFLLERRRADPQRFPDLSLCVVKLLGAGEYVLELPGEPSPGHFGLAVRDYTHSTAPNRRFPDLITQRLLKAALANAPPPYPLETLRALAAHCTQQENSAAKVERQVAKSGAALLLAPRIGAHFDAIVTGASAEGTWVRIMSPAVEGRVVRGMAGLDVGDRVAVELLSTNVQRGYIDFAALGSARPEG
jgi:exoribonuclease-2